MRKHCINWIWLLLLLKLILIRGEQQAEDHRIQRRFMWQEMNNSVMGGVLGRMFNGARAMKSMFTDLMPSTAGYAQKSNMDFLPTEMTRVKYIIRNPHNNKPMKIIKMRPSPKKVVKLRRPIPKPTVTESTVMIAHSIHGDHRMRQLEKEQELIAEGKAPMTSDEAIMEKYFKKRPRGGSSNEVISGKIMEYQSWKPVYKAGETPSSFVTLRPQALTHLHTDISSGGDHEMLPKPEKLVSYEYEREEEEEAENEVAKQMGHRYEVTEHTGEASGEVETVEAVASMESGFVPSQGMTFRSQPPPPPRPRHRSPSSTTTTTTSTTTEAPNYPASFLKKFREREASTTTRRPRKHHHHNKEVYVIREDEDNSVGSTTPPSFAMSSLRARLQDQQRHQRQQHKQQLEEEDDLESALVDAMHGEKWPSEVAHSGFQLSSPIGPSAVAFEQPLAKAPRGQYKRQTRDNIRQRGSVKFNDKPNYDEA
ncbi:uncharacterized protein LOC119552037 [Drosophila subpulchrella]|uniref:uncharacterized protein LOC119552037 n=1 Tax=Drosophila subpulchrella TaxID=1486046 RepID=UPI0018A14327|nr:uncharacterized protein LOC119552037 [Drosophila subpulchrella]